MEYDSPQNIISKYWVRQFQVSSQPNPLISNITFIFSHVFFKVLTLFLSLSLVNDSPNSNFIFFVNRFHPSCETSLNTTTLLALINHEFDDLTSNHEAGSISSSLVGHQNHHLYPDLQFLQIRRTTHIRIYIVCSQKLY